MSTTDVPLARTLHHRPPVPSRAASLARALSVSHSSRHVALVPGPNKLMPLAGHALRHRAAGAFGPDLAKKLTQLVKMEKNVMRSMEQVAKERMEVAVRRHPLPTQPLVLPPFSNVVCVCSNNYPYGAREETRTFRMLPTSWVSCFMRLASWRTSTSTDTTSTVSP
jgi:hypothetical protein